jgi:hypothetical protein
MRVGLFIPCYMDAFEHEAGVATLELLVRLGCDVEYNNGWSSTERIRITPQCYAARAAPASSKALAGFHNPHPAIYKRTLGCAAYPSGHVATRSDACVES